jgi:hypothetical protein
MLEWVAIWKPLPKVVFSTALPTVQGNARLASGGLAQEIERSRAQPSTSATARHAGQFARRALGRTGQPAA